MIIESRIYMKYLDIVEHCQSRVLILFDFSSSFICVGEGEQHYGRLSVCTYQSVTSNYAASKSLSG